MKIIYWLIGQPIEQAVAIISLPLHTTTLGSSSTKMAVFAGWENYSTARSSSRPIAEVPNNDSLKSIYPQSVLWDNLCPSPSFLILFQCVHLAFRL